MMNKSMRMHRDANTRGAALILEIIIYLVIVALIAVAVTSGVRAVRDLVFTMHAKNDIAQIHQFMEGGYIQNGTYTELSYANNPITTNLNLTQVGNDKNFGKTLIRNGANSGYCVAVTSATISGQKKLFWSTSDNPSKIMQRGTKSADSFGSGPFDDLCYTIVHTGIGEG